MHQYPKKLCLFGVVIEEACDLMAVARFLELRNAGGALVHALGAAVIEIATGAALVRRRHIAGQDDALALALHFGVGYRRS